MSIARSTLRRAGQLACLLAFMSSLATADSSTAEPIRTGEYGKELVTTASIPLSKFSDRDDWVGAAATMDSKKNPYTIIVTVEGTARADGDVSMLWNAGWSVGGISKMRPAMGGAVRNVKAGEHVVVRRAAPPSQFEVDKEAAPAVSLVRVENLDIQRVDMELWSGFAKMGWLDWIRSMPILAFGVVMLVVAILFLRR